MSLALYVYYRAPIAAREAVQTDLARAFGALMAARPGLQCRLLRRAADPTDPTDPAALVAPSGSPPPGSEAAAVADDTWMEIHEREGTGLDAADAQAIQAACRDLPAARIGPRHMEWFSDPAGA